MRMPIFLLAALLAVGNSARAETVQVFAAASTTNALGEIGALFAKTGHKMVATYASSATLAKQIENDAPAQLFISADDKWMDYLEAKKLVIGRTSLLGNKLALVAPSDSKVQLTPMAGFPIAEALGKDGRLAVGDPTHVPAGAYAEQALKSLAVWSAVENRLARADSVRAALALVERGEAPLGIVYTTDAAVTAKVRIVAVFPDSSHAPISYPAALVAGKETPAARALLDFLKGPAARDLFAKYGFLVK